MMIRNRDKGTVLCSTCEVAESSWQKTRGLMFRKELPDGHGMLFRFGGTGSAGIWMLGMRFPIDIVFIGKDGKITRIVENARPMGLSWRTWRIYFPPGPVGFVLELPAGKARESRTSVGDALEL